MPVEFPLFLAYSELVYTELAEVAKGSSLALGRFIILFTGKNIHRYLDILIAHDLIARDTHPRYESELGTFVPEIFSTRMDILADHE